MIIPRTTKLGAALVVAAVLGWAPIASAQVPKYTPLLPATQVRFTLDLPIPVDYVPDRATFPGFDYYEVKMSPVTPVGVAFPQGGCAYGTQWLGLTNAGAKVCTPVWGYSQTNSPTDAGGNPLYPLNGASTYPSMNFRALKGRPVKVMWKNEAPDQHLFCPFPLNANEPCAIDRTLMGVQGPANSVFGGPQQADNAMVVHLHGGEIPPDSDGFAELWFGNVNSQAAYPANAYPTASVANSSFGATQNIEPIFDTSLTTSNGVEIGNLVRPTTSSMIYNYPMVQAAAPIWYHDHALGKTRINVAAGPAGFFIVEDPAVEGPLYNAGALPPRGDCSVGGVLKNAGNAAAASACFDINVAIQDRAFNTDGSINFPNGLGQAPPVGAIAPWLNMTAAELAAWQAGLTPGPNRDHPQWVPEYFGDMSVVNGVIWPKLKVEPRPYRLRLLDGSNARCYELQMKSATLKAAGLPVPKWNIIGSDQGYLPAVAAKVTTLVMCPGERYEVVVDFSAVPPGNIITVSNGASAPYPAGIKPNGQSIYAFMGDIMQFQVVAADPTNKPAPAPWVIPAALVARGVLPAAAKTRQMVLNEVLDPVTLAPLRVQIDGKRFEDAVTETPKRGTVEQWTIVNTSVDAHPMHLHLVQFQVVSRQSFDLAGFQAALGATNPALPVQNYNLAASVTPFLKGKPRAPEPGESGWKDTARAYPGEVLTLVAKWDGGWADAPTGGPCTVGTLCNPAAATFTSTDPLTGTAIPVVDGAGNPVPTPTWEPVTAGPYVWHCHIVDHEDNEMMRPSLVIP